MKKILFILLLISVTMTGQAQDKDIRKTIENGIRTSIRQTENHEWKEAFATCRDLDAAIARHEAETKKQAPHLHYQVSKERLRMYLRLKNDERCKEQLERMESYAAQARSAIPDEDLLMAQADYHQKFGRTDKSLQCYRQLVNKRTAGKNEQDIAACYKDMLRHAQATGNQALERAIDKLYTAWQDSVKSVKAAQELQSLQNEYAEAQTTLRQKEQKISSQQGFIGILCVLAAALAGGLLFLFGVTMKHTRQIKKLKQSLALANDNNEQKSRFIHRIGRQITPSLDAIAAGNEAERHMESLKALLSHTARYMELENSREEYYETKDLNISTLCENIMNKAKETFRPEVTVALNVPRVNVRTHAEALEHVLLYLLRNAARHTESGKISLEFKKRSAHSGQFIVTDTGTGIPPEKRANLFKPFTEVHDLTQGDGFGLPTCALIAYKLNGTLRLDEEYKKGTRFVLELHS